MVLIQKIKRHMLWFRTYIALEYIILLKSTKEKELLGILPKDLKFPRLKECTEELLEKPNALFRLLPSAIQNILLLTPSSRYNLGITNKFGCFTHRRQII